MVLHCSYQPEKRSVACVKNVLIVTPVGLEPTALGLTGATTTFAADFRL